MSYLGAPTEAGYLLFLRNIAGIPTSALPDASPSIPLSYNIALDITSKWLECISGDIYTLCVYNLATDRLINFAADTPPSTFFADARKSYTLNVFVPGVVQDSHDETTGQSLLVPDFYKALTLLDQSIMQTPFGRTYLGYEQQLGSLWGVS